MTEKNFKRLLFQGRGNALLEVKKHPQRYFEYALNLCRKHVSYDPQCEGTRSAYTYDILCEYGDKTPFLRQIADSLNKTKNGDLYNILYLSELLLNFGNDGCDEAVSALWEKYEELMSELCKKGRKNKRYRAALALERLCFALVRHKKSYVSICSDIGSLYLRESFFEVYDFDWLFSVIYDEKKKTLDKLSEKNANIAEFIRIGLKNKAERRESFESYKNNKEKATDEDMAKRYTEAECDEEKIRALDIFSYRNFPFDPSPLIADADSANTDLKNAAIYALQNVRHPLVKKFALDHIGEGTEYLKIFIANYGKGDERNLVEAVKTVPVDRFDKSDWHGVFLYVLIEIGDNNKKIPSELLKYLYETTYCSFCRECIVEQMRKQRVLSEEILTECLYDCNYDLRAYAKKISDRNRKRVFNL